MVAARLGHVLCAVGTRRLDHTGELGGRPRELAARARCDEIVAHQPPLDERVPRELSVRDARVVGRRLLCDAGRQPADVQLLVGAQRLGERAAAAPLIEDAVECGPVRRGQVVLPVADAAWPGLGLGSGWGEGEGEREREGEGEGED